MDECKHSTLRQMNDGPSYLCPCGAEGYLTKSGRFLTWDEVEQLGDMMDTIAASLDIAQGR